MVRWWKRGEWVEHPCKPPTIWSQHQIGEYWRCKCGRIWKAIRRSDYYNSEVWQAIKPDLSPMTNLREASK